MDSLISKEEYEAIASKIWEEKKAELVKTVEGAMRSEMSTLAGSIARKLVASEAEKIIRPILVEKRAELEELAQNVASRFFRRFAETTISSFQDVSRALPSFLIGAMNENLIRHIQQTMGAAYRESEKLQEADLGIDTRYGLSCVHRENNYLCHSYAARVLRNRLLCEVHYKMETEKAAPNV